jgi:hypothetical protein
MITFFKIVLIKMLSTIFNSFDHLKERKMTYIEHLKEVLSISFSLCKANICLLIHGLYPPFFTTTASSIILDLNEKLTLLKSKK